MQRKRTRRLAIQPQARNRQRAYSACVQCRRRKRKCDGADPCSSCISYGYPCSYVQHGGSEQGSQHEASQIGTNILPTLTQPVAAVASSQGMTLENGEIVRRNQKKPSPRSRLIINKGKSRFVEGNSAIALPHLLSRSLNETLPLRLHSFAWHLGIRPIHTPHLPTALSQHLTLDECCYLSSRYFSVVHPVFPFLSKATYFSRLRSSWSSSPDGQPDFTALVAGVSALGSFFSETPHARELDIKQYAISVLDLSFSAQIAPVTLDTVSGWILRTLYARLTCRPPVSSIATHVTMHMVDMLSLHKDVGSDDTLSVSGDQVRFTVDETDARRRHYWVACTLNRLLCAEFGVTSVELSQADCSPILASAVPEQVADEFQHVVSLGQVLVSLKGECSEDHMDTAFTQLGHISNSIGAALLFRADACLCLLREMLSRNKRPTSTIINQAVPILHQCLQIIPSLIKDHQSWWNTISVPFQTICISLFIDTKDFLALLVPAIEALRLIAVTYESHLAEEALKDAHRLIMSSKRDTTANMDLKDDAMRHVAPCDGNLAAELYIDAERDWPMDIDFDTFDLESQLFTGI